MPVARRVAQVERLVEPPYIDLKSLAALLPVPSASKTIVLPASLSAPEQ
jgi:hypothetical protein